MPRWSCVRAEPCSRRWRPRSAPWSEGALPAQADRVAVGGRCVRRPTLRHLAVAFEEHAFLDHDHRGLDVAVDARRTPQLDPLGGEDVTDHLTVDQDHPGANRGAHDALLADDEAVAGVDLAAELAVHHDGALKGVLALDLGALVDEGREIAAPARLLALAPPHGVRLPLAAELRGPEVVHQIDRPLAGGELVHLRDVAVEEAALGDHQRIGRDVAGDPARVGDLDVAGRDHVALVVSLDDGIDGLDVGVDHALLADDQLAADVHLAADLALDLDRVRDVELALHARALADHREQGDCRGGGLPVLRRRQRVRLLGTLLVTEHRKTPYAVR